VNQSNPVAESYDRLAPVYDRRWRSYEEATLRAALEAADLRGGEIVLDVACGTGELERLLLARHPNLYILGTDISAGMLTQAVHKDIGPRARWVQGDARRLPLPDRSFDSVLCANSFHYFREPQAALSEMRRVLRPGGFLVLVDWCDDYLTCKVCSWWLRWTDPAFYRADTLRGCQTLIEEAGFQVVQRRRFRVGWLWGLMQFVAANR
jgi:ubiquinone/menaquinone biosynthesis C-methylase UbiE